MTPIWGKVYLTTHAQGTDLKELISNLVDKGFMRRYNSTCLYYIFSVKKADGGLSACVNYSPINLITVQDIYTIPSDKHLTKKMNAPVSLPI